LHNDLRSIKYLVCCSSSSSLWDIRERRLRKRYGKQDILCCCSSIADSDELCTWDHGKCMGWTGHVVFISVHVIFQQYKLLICTLVIRYHRYINSVVDYMLIFKAFCVHYYNTFNITCMCSKISRHRRNYRCWKWNRIILCSICRW
jgi:hypothetical protein